MPVKEALPIFSAPVLVPILADRVSVFPALASRVLEVAVFNEILPVIAPLTPVLLIIVPPFKLIGLLILCPATSKVAPLATDKTCPRMAVALPTCRVPFATVVDTLVPP